MISHWGEYIGVLSVNGRDTFKGISYHNIDSSVNIYNNVRQELSSFVRGERRLSLNFFPRAVSLWLTLPITRGGLKILSISSL